MADDSGVISSPPSDSDSPAVAAAAAGSGSDADARLVLPAAIVAMRFMSRPAMNPGFEIPPFLTVEGCVHAPPARVRTFEERLGSLTPEQRAAYLTVKELAQGEGIHRHFDDWAIVRYCIAREFHLDKTMKMLRNTADWINSYNPSSVKCSVCPVRPQAHMMEFVGWDLQHRPVVYSSFKWASERTDPATSLEHNVEAFQHLISLMPVGVEQWTAVTDFVGYSHMRDGNPRVSSTVVGALQDHFPERLSCYLLIDPPTLFWVLWKCLSMLINEKTRSKVMFVYTTQKPNMADVFPTVFPPHLTEYLTRTFLANKSS